jgi:hypothetical protein
MQRRGRASSTKFTTCLLSYPQVIVFKRFSRIYNWMHDGFPPAPAFSHVAHAFATPLQHAHTVRSPRAPILELLRCATPRPLRPFSPKPFPQLRPPPSYSPPHDSNHPASSFILFASNVAFSMLLFLPPPRYQAGTRRPGTRRPPRPTQMAAAQSPRPPLLPP